MKSRIPHHKLTSTSTSTYKHPPTRRTNPEDTDPSQPVLAAFIALGAPPIPPDEFKRLYRGPFADALLFISEHMRGREAVAVARGQIAGIREARSGSASLKLPDEITRSAVDRAVSSLSAAKKTLEVYRTQLEERQILLEKSQTELEHLKRQLEDRRRVALLLEMVERKESVRVQRFEEMTRLMGNLRKSVGETKLQVPVLNRNDGTGIQSTELLSSIPRAPRVSHTRDTLAAFHAHHARLTRLSKPQSQNHNHNHALTTTRLRHAITRRLGTSDSHPKVDELINQLTSAARTRAKAKPRYQGGALPTGTGAITREDLEERWASNVKKEEELQRLSDLSVALNFLTEHYIKSTTVFRDVTSGILHDHMDTEAPLAMGYIELLRWHIIDGMSARGEQGSTERKRDFVKEAGAMCGMKGNVAPRAILAEAERVLRRAYEQETFHETTQKVISRLAPTADPEQDALIVSYETAAQLAHDRAVRLLTRKVEKAALGYKIAEDVEGTLRESRAIVGRE